MHTHSLRLVVIALFSATATLLRAAIAPAENLLPADTLAFFTVPDCAAFRATATQAPEIMFWNDPAMKPFHDKFMAKFNETYIAPLEKDLGVKAGDFLDLLQGQFTLAVTANGSKGNDDVPSGLLLLLDAKNKSDLLKTNLAALTKKWNAAGRALRTEKINGIAFTVVPLGSNDFSGLLPKRAPVQELGKEPKPEKAGEIYFAQFESLLLVGNTTKAVEGVAAHLNGGSAPALADEATFAADKPALFRDSPQYFGWFNGSKFFSLLAQAPDDNDASETPSFFPKISFAKILGATGLDGLKSASMVMRENREGSLLTLHVTAPAAGRRGLLKMLSLPPKDTSAPAFAPASAMKFSRLRLDGKQLWAELQKMVAAISPQALAGMNSVIDIANSSAQQKNPGFDLRTALFGNLGDDFISYQKAPAGDSLEALANPPTIYLLAVANPDQVIESVKVLAALSGTPSAVEPPREFLGRKIYTIALRPTRNAATGGAKANSLYVATSGGYLALSGDTAILEEYLRSADGNVKPLAETTGLADAAQRAGGTGGGLFGYQNGKEAMRVSFKLFKDSVQADATLRSLPPAIREWTDFSLLPEYEAVQKYFYLSVFTGSANADGLTVKMFTPRPPGLN